MLNVPNVLTLFRLILLPFIVALMFLPYAWAAGVALALYVIGSITDFLDGWVARKFDQVTAFGTFMDPISDKIYVSTIMLMLVATGRIWGVWVIFAILILGREFMISGLREYLGPKGIKVPVSQLAKWKTASQMLAIGVLIIAPYFMGGLYLGILLLVGACTLTLYTGWDYLKVGWEHMAEDEL